ncbi:NtaA/DmoA family FMN-dependent monooxygenase [Pseudonocardia xishanensis]
MARHLIYSAFVHLTPSHESHGFWRHPEGRHMVDYGSISAWTEVVQTLERARFDMVFFGDTVGVYDTHQGSSEPAVRNGMQFPGRDPAPYVAALSRATSDIGFVFTSAMLQEPPFTFARKVSTLDHLSDGRVGWNIVTSYLDNAAQNYGLETLPDHDARYAWAEEYTDVTYRLWEGSWEEGALVADPERGVLVDPKLVHRVDHHGERYQVAGPHLVEPSPQRTPLLVQAGASAAGTAFAARHAEMSFVPSSVPEATGRTVANLKDQAVAAGRGRDDIRAIVNLAPILGSTVAEAQARQREFREWLDVDGLCSFLSGIFGVDLSTVDPDRTLESISETRAVQGTLRSIIDRYPDRSVTFGEMLKGYAFSGQLAGTPETIADEIAAWADAGVDGFNIIPVTTLGWWAEFTEHVVPVLQRRGLMRTEYAPGTLREKLFGADARLPEVHPARRYSRR